MPLLEGTIATARARGYLPLGHGGRWMSELPKWLDDFQRPDGANGLESRLGVPLPAVVKEFWSNPSLVRLLDSWRWLDYLCEEPMIVTWNAAQYLSVCSHPHSGGIGAVRLGAGDDPPMYWGWEHEQSPMQLAAERFSEHVRLAVEGGPA